MLQAKLSEATTAVTADVNVGIEFEAQMLRRRIPPPIAIQDESYAYSTVLATEAAIVVVATAITTIIALVIAVVIKREFLVLEERRAWTCRRAHSLRYLSSQQLSM